MTDNASSKPGDQDSGPSLHSEQRLHDDVRFEDSHVSVFGIIGVLIALFVVFVGVFFISGWMLKGIETPADRAAKAPQYLESTDAKPLQPRLEPLDFETGIPASVFESQLKAERVLHAYGAAAEDGYVHIPIERAMELVLKSLPIRKGATGPPERSFGLVGGGESNSGRLYSEAPSWLKQKH